jgi:hypothetical protein
MEWNGTKRREGGIQPSTMHLRCLQAQWSWHGRVHDPYSSTQVLSQVQESAAAGRRSQQITGAALVRVCVKQLCCILSLKQWRPGGIGVQAPVHRSKGDVSTDIEHQWVMHL